MILSVFHTKKVDNFAENRKFTSKEVTRAEFDRNKRITYHSKYQHFSKNYIFLIE